MTKDVKNTLDQEFKSLNTYSTKTRTKLNSRQLKALEYIETNGKITRSEYTQLMGVSFMTAYRDLQDMLDKKYIIRNGKRKSAYYTLTDGFEKLRKQEKSEKEYAKPKFQRISDF